MRVIAAVDKFRGTATAHEVASAIGDACWDLGHEVVEIPLADGGEGLLDVFGGPNRHNTVTGPLGTPVEAGWRSNGKTAIIEMAQAAGLQLAGGAEGNRPLDATTAGVGELILAAVSGGAKRVIVGLGGSATTDGGLGALQAIGSKGRIAGVTLDIACDVSTRFTDAPRVFGPQKGASATEIKFLEGRLERLAQQYLDDYGIDVREISGSGAAGGLAGGLVALGGTIQTGFDLVADEVGLYDAIESADLVITGEGFMDEQSFQGKVVGGVAGLAQRHNVPVVIICGDAESGVSTDIPVHTLVARWGEQRAFSATRQCIAGTAREILQSFEKR